MYRSIHIPAGLWYAARVSILLTIFSALLLALALPNEIFPWGLALPGLVSLVPVLLVVYRASSWRQAARLGALFGAISTAVANYWLAFFGDFSVWTIGGAVVGYTGYNYILFGFLFYFIHTGSGGHGNGRWYRPLQVALLWTAYEYVKSVGFLGYPWGLIAYPLATWITVAQSAEIAGVWGLSFLAAWINASLAEVLDRRDRHVPAINGTATGIGSRTFSVPRLFSDFRSAGHIPTGFANLRAALLVLVVLVGFGALRLHSLQPDHDTPTANVLVVQQNIDSWAPGRFDDALVRVQTLTMNALEDHRKYHPDRPVDFVLWSETTLRRPYREEDQYYREVPDVLPLTMFLALLDRPLVTGVPMPVEADPSRDSGNGPAARDLTNSAIVLNPDGTVSGSYAKQQLVPFAESIPFWSSPMVRRFFRDVVGLWGTWVPGRESSVVTIPLRDGTEVTVGLPICFEDAFGWVPREMTRNGATVLLNLTNNSWSRQDSAQTQHYVAARLRSIELRTPLVRGTNSGLSGVVDRRGVATETLPMFESRAAVMEVPLTRPQWTLYRTIGDLPGRAAFMLVLGLVLIRSRARRPRHVDAGSGTLPLHNHTD